MIIAVVQHEKIVERIVVDSPRDIQRGHRGDDTRLVDITDQHWLKVGDYWGPDKSKWVANPEAKPELPVA